MSEHVESSERFPERDQAPIANDRNEAIVGDPGFGSQSPQTVQSDVDRPVASSPPPPQHSGTAETRGAGDSVESVQEPSGGSDSPPEEGDQQQGGRATGPVAGQPGDPQQSEEQQREAERLAAERQAAGGSAASQ